MKAVAFSRHLPIDDPEALQDIVLPRPQPGPRDLLVRVEAASVNPVDAKLRGPRPGAPALLDQPRVLGFDAAGVVEAVGNEVELFQPGDEVYYAGDATRPGCNAQYHLVDERLVGPKPTTLDFAEAAALPLATITAWELLFERMPFHLDAEGNTRSLLVIGGAGGVGSMAIQLARHAGFTVIATASRPQTQAWCRRMGAHHVIDHRQPLAPQLQALGFASVDAAVNLADTDRYWDALGELLAPQGHVGLIVEPTGALRIGDPYKAKCIGIHWEFMFARPRFRTADMIHHHRILTRVGSLVEAGELRSPLTEVLGPIDATGLRQAHRRMESGSTIGKLVLAGWA
ncbi:MAG: zinc-binding alcohol dehydrogenase family protein [Pseudoxanthomonas sp.]|nr:zinc-binding alcohol dehydrogenase family protein [Pseudoxanthomonas sp.]MBP7464848.1 zinc-binding alcohol dehydrogenase family protein [Pseudoxanthomonas sp.]MBP8740388.1 zinc-binding alcohol dehydrogenase family protein [Pseudoxanthomonas sp.]MBP8907821.1 zinc-binding alcohol dehydrogenase family protein [Pseudoxanthomonas sp.]MBP9645933.1 zinc-binding alcohol dehydrogenase family protein [Pseudoxanthomonas sp.]